MNKLVLIDGNAIMHRAFHALPPLTTRAGEPINAVYGFVSMLLRVITDLKPTHIAVAFDRKEPTFRHVEFEDYQAHRPETDEDLSPQFDKAKDVIKTFGIPFYDKVGFEADDVIGTIAKKARVDEVVIVTGDKDILQLVNDKVKVYLPIKGLADAQLMGDKEVVKKMGVKPSQIDDYKALVGDPSDNYKGVPGVGPKTAGKLLSKYKNFTDIYKNLDKIDEPARKKLIEGRESAKMSYKLAQIITDVDVKLDLRASGKWKLDSQKTLDLFAEYGFRTLAKRVKNVGKKIEAEKQMKLL